MCVCVHARVSARAWGCACVRARAWVRARVGMCVHACLIKSWHTHPPSLPLACSVPGVQPSRVCRGWEGGELEGDPVFSKSLRPLQRAGRSIFGILIT